MSSSASDARPGRWQQFDLLKSVTTKGRLALVAVVILVATFALMHSLSWRPHIMLPGLMDKHRRIACTTWPRLDTPATASDALAGTAMKPASPDNPHPPKPSGFKIVALVFFGRREYVDILDCYLRRDLVSNNGYIDEVHFVSNARDHKDSAWLDVLVDSVPEYRNIPVPKRCESSVAWTGCLWDVAADRDTLYIKIDDDLIYIHEDTVSSIVQTRLKYKDAFVISANLVNVRTNAWMHFHNNAIHPYLPEPDVTRVQDPKRSWRTSEDPMHSGKSLKPMTLQKVVGLKHPFRGHRWLRLNNTDAAILKTPIAAIEMHMNEPAVHDSWAINAQQQYSLLENLETNQLGRYHVGGEDGVWDAQYRRCNINFVAIWGSDVADNLPFDREQTFAIDEQLLTEDLPRETGRPFLVDSRALALHYSFRTQLRVGSTDLLDRWRAYANEMVCDRPREPFGRLCKGVKKARKPPS